MINFKSDVSLPFEVVLVTRDSEGEPTGTKSFSTDSPYKLNEFFLRMKGKPKKRTHKDVKGKKPSTEKEIKTVLNEVEKYVSTKYQDGPAAKTEAQN